MYGYVLQRHAPIRGQTGGALLAMIGTSEVTALSQGESSKDIYLDDQKSLSLLRFD